MERNQIDKKYTWQTEIIFPDMQAWEKAFAELESRYVGYDYTRFIGKLADKNVLLDCLKTADEVSRAVEKLYIYAHLRHDEDVRVSATTSALARIGALASKLFAEFAFVEPELTALPEAQLKGWIADPDFADYDYKLQRIIQDKAHVLSANEEKLLALGSDVMGGFQDVFMMLDNANLHLPKATFNGEEMQISHGTYGVVLHTGKAEERKEWFEKYYGAYISLIDTITQTYYGNVKKDVFYKTVRGYDSCLAMALSGEDVPPAVYKNLIEATHGALPIMHDYISFRKSVLGLPEQHMYDVYVPLVEDAELSLSFDEAYELVVEGLAPLGKDYQQLLMQGKTARWIDVYETEGKRSGAYSTGTYDAPHPFVLLNYQQTMNDVFTIAHEMGHALHTYKSISAQPYAKASYTIFLAEIASTVNEVLLLKHLYTKSTDVKTKKYLLNYYLDSIRATLFRQTHFAEFEQLAHEMAERGEALTKESLNALYYDLNKKYYGEGITHDEQIAYEWARIPHFYNAFYVYKYATGIISAISIVKRILTEGESAVKDYFAFLSSGACEPPVEILKKAGVDLTTAQPFQVAMQEFENTLNELKDLFA